jgi:ketopantoate reductase
MAMDISVIGPGAVGTLLGSLLQCAGHRVTLRGRSPGPAAAHRVVLPTQWLLAEGLRSGSREETASSADAILVTLGRNHLHAERRPDFARLIGPGESPVALFNADPEEAVRLAIPPGRLRLCLSLMSAVRLQDADVELCTEKPVLLYEKDPLLARIFPALGKYGFQVAAVQDLVPSLNSFFIYQLLFLPVAMCNTTVRDFLSYPQGRELALSILGEGFAALEKAGMPLAALPLMDPGELSQRLQKKPAVFDGDRGAPEREYNSVLQSYLRGKPTEAAHVNRRVVEIASAAGLHLTWNWRIVQKASRVASIGFYRDPPELLKALV